MQLIALFSMQLITLFSMQLITLFSMQLNTLFSLQLNTRFSCHVIAPSLYNDQQHPTTTIAKSEFSNFASKKRSQAALGNINQAYIALACTDIAL